MSVIPKASSWASKNACHVTGRNTRLLQDTAATLSTIIRSAKPLRVAAGSLCMCLLGFLRTELFTCFAPIFVGDRLFPGVLAEKLASNAVSPVATTPCLSVGAPEAQWANDTGWPWAAMSLVCVWHISVSPCPGGWGIRSECFCRPSDGQFVSLQKLVRDADELLDVKRTLHRDSLCDRSGVSRAAVSDHAHVKCGLLL